MLHFVVECPRRLLHFKKKFSTIDGSQENKQLDFVLFKTENQKMVLKNIIHLASFLQPEVMSCIQSPSWSRIQYWSSLGIFFFFQISIECIKNIKASKVYAELLVHLAFMSDRTCIMLWSLTMRKMILLCCCSASIKEKSACDWFARAASMDLVELKGGNLRILAAQLQTSFTRDSEHGSIWRELQVAVPTPVRITWNFLTIWTFIHGIQFQQFTDQSCVCLPQSESHWF